MQISDAEPVQKVQNDISKLNISNNSNSNLNINSSNSNNLSVGTSISEKIVLERKNSGDEKKSNTKSNNTSLTTDQLSTKLKADSVQQQEKMMNVNQTYESEEDSGRCSIM